MELVKRIIEEFEARKNGRTSTLSNLSFEELVMLAEKLRLF